MNEMSLCGFCGRAVPFGNGCCPNCGTMHRDCGNQKAPYGNIQKRISRLEIKVSVLEAEIDHMLAAVS